MFEGTSARLPVCQNRDVLWTELRWYNDLYAAISRSVHRDQAPGSLEQEAR